MTGSILAINAGSSSLKFALYDEALAEAVRGEIENLDGAPHFFARDTGGKMLAEKRWGGAERPSFTEMLAAVLGFAEAHVAGALAAVGHRIVHGGAEHSAPALVTPGLLRALEALTPLSPLHMPHSLAPIRTIAATRPGLAQVACFDTGFHSTLPHVARTFALPRAVTDSGVRRYGFHGLSYEYIASVVRRDLPVLAGGSLVVAHLGSGASLCALKDGISIATTMGFSELDGLPMATRCGRLDPGVMLYLGAQGRSFADLGDMITYRSGLLGVSGISGDVRALLASAHPHAKEAIALLTYQIALETAGMACALGGMQGLVFTAGIGEHAPEIRASVCARLGWLGVILDEAANAANGFCISTAASRVAVHVIPTDEEAMIARHTRSLTQAQGPRHANS
jgi:acetate kinase